ncbi:DUF192 domain-containing protein [Gottfriedia acidiceleris]|uniref:DUF192 domain-containing protein n=1 Tax=Gottfriedia acidiceleris TaxID=371036 RepID=UPI00101D4053|nr:DUF192 domain-containing protein [Gottfriedia acidiceleris]
MLKASNRDLNRTIPYTIKKADKFTSRLKGLMFRKKPLNQEGLWIIPCNSIHMCFMNFPIDVVFLNKNKQIVKLINNLQPWKFVAPVSDAYSVLELPVGVIEEFKLEIGQILEL